MQWFIGQIWNKTGLNGRREYFLGESQVFTVELILGKKTLTIHYVDRLGFPRWFSGKESSCQAGNTGFRSLGGQDSLEKEMTTCSGILAWEIWSAEEPDSYSPWGISLGLSLSLSRSLSLSVSLSLSLGLSLSLSLTHTHTHIHTRTHSVRYDLKTKEQQWG